MRWIISIISLWVEQVQIYKDKILLKSITELKDDRPPQMFTVQFTLFIKTCSTFPSFGQKTSLSLCCSDLIYSSKS